MPMPSSEAIQVGTGDGRRYRDTMTKAERIMRYIIQGTAPGRPVESRWNDLTEYHIGGRIVPLNPDMTDEQKEWMRKGFLVVGMLTTDTPTRTGAFRDFEKAAEQVFRWGHETLRLEARAMERSNTLVRKLIRGLAEFGNFSMHDRVVCLRSAKFSYREGTPSVFIGFCSWAFFDQWRVDKLGY